MWVDVLSCSCSCKSSPTKHSEKNVDVNLDWDDVFKDAYLANLEIASDADLENRIQVEKPVCV